MKLGSCGVSRSYLDQLPVCVSVIDGVVLPGHSVGLPKDGGGDGVRPLGHSVRVMVTRVARLQEIDDEFEFTKFEFGISGWSQPHVRGSPLYV